jgi:hypothetical protein
MVPGGGFLPVHLPFLSDAPAFRHLEVVKVPAEDDVLGAEVGLSNLLLERGSVI